jgi:nuclear pore complex protein Nup205
MSDIKLWLQQIAEKLSGASVLDKLQHVEVVQMVEYQRVSLVKQHESLAVILVYLVKESHSVMADFDIVLETMRKADKYDNLLCKRYFTCMKTFCTTRNISANRAPQYITFHHWRPSYHVLAVSMETLLMQEH